MDEPYMGADAAAIWARTRELNDAAWEAVGPAFLGSALALFALIPGVILATWPDAHLAVRIGAGALAVAGLIVGAVPVVRWNNTIAAVKEHSRRMREETAKRGKGWAR